MAVETQALAAGGDLSAGQLIKWSDQKEDSMEFIRNEAEAGKVLINKLAAAEQQLGAAIRMYFMEEDSLAIHTLASAAFNVYADLLRHRGKDPAYYGLIFGILTTAKAYIAGDLSNKDLAILGEGTLQVLQPTIDILKENPNLDINEVTVSGSADGAREFYRKKRQAYNFLKHADHDPSAMLDGATINNEDMICQAITCSGHLNCQFTPEKEWFVAAMSAFGELDLEGSVLIWLLQSHSREEVMHLARRNLCYSRVNDDLLIDFDRVREKGHKLINDYFEKKKTRGETE